MVYAPAQIDHLRCLLLRLLSFSTITSGKTHRSSHPTLYFPPHTTYIYASLRYQGGYIVFKLTKTILSLILGLTIAGCGKTILLQNYPDNVFPKAWSGKQTPGNVEKAIVRAAMSKGWVIDKEDEGKLVATLNIRKHRLVMVIEFDDHSYSLTYRDSSNLLYDGKRIHRQYANWVKNLTYSIDANLATL